MVFIGDLYQLPPVVTGPERQAFDACYETPYFYSAKALQSFDMDLVELEKIYRQHDRDFIDLLNSIRNNSVTQPQLDQLNTRFKPDFEPEEDDFYIYLTTTNQMAKEINASRLALLETPLYSFSAQIQGEFGREYLPTAIDLEVKTGAQVMLLNNDTAGRWVNGSVGKITAIEPGEKEEVITVELQDGNPEKVTPNTWEIFRFFIEDGKLCTEPIGSFRQYPLMLAWAVTIHKSQGKTFEKVIIDIGKGSFAHGQTYVALSRCTTLDGIILKKPILKKHIWSDYRIPNFLTRYQYDRAEASFPLDEKIALIKQAIENGDFLEMVYLKPNDEKSQRTVRPLAVGEMQYCGKSYPGMRAFCTLKKAERTFRVDRILALKRSRP
jgi:ATP-dependent exoDNAse (exonuclease V) alpha subunit